MQTISSSCCVCIVKLGVGGNLLYVIMPQQHLNLGQKYRHRFCPPLSCMQKVEIMKW